MKTCSKCKSEQPLENFSKTKKHYQSWCKSCSNKQKKSYYYKNKERISLKNKSYYQNNKTELLAASKAYYESNKQQKSNYDKLYYFLNKDRISIRLKSYYSNNKHSYILRNKNNSNLKYKTDPFFKLRSLISSGIRKALKKLDSPKSSSILDFLPNSILEIKRHLESLFSHPDNLHNAKPWMNWSNWGTYNSTWDDNDPSTWTWQIDHIIPQSRLPYSSMEDNNFKKCWSIKNLRPLSSKQNLLEGNRAFPRSKKKIKEQFINEANILHNYIYSYKNTVYLESHIKISITCKSHGDFQQTPANHLKGQRCPKCADLTRCDPTKLTNEDIDNSIPSTIKRISDYINSNEKLSWECQICKLIWQALPNPIRRGGTGCPKCKDTKLSNSHIDEFLILNNVKIKRVDEYVNAYTKISWQCLSCDNVWKAKPGEIKRKNRGSGCPNCARGKNERLVGETLKELNINCERIRIDLPNQKIFPDFYLPQHNVIIEYNGIQHYQPTCFGNGPIYDTTIVFQKQQKRDKTLRVYCLENNITLLEIDGREYKGKKLVEFVRAYFRKGE